VLEKLLEYLKDQRVLALLLLALLIQTIFQHSYIITTQPHGRQCLPLGCLYPLLLVFRLCYTNFMHIILLDAVEKFLSTLTEKEIARVLRAIELLEEFGNQLEMPHSKHLADGLLELRIHGPRQIRIFYCFYKSKAILVHANIKKTRKALNTDIIKARTAKERLYKYNF
jgi:phage-related protein